jgi:hypothetical protein
MIDYGKMPYMSQAKDYVSFMKEVTDQAILSQGGIYAPMDMKKPYMSKTYEGMVYTFQSDFENLSGLDAPTLDDAYVSNVAYTPTAYGETQKIVLMPIANADDSFTKADGNLYDLPYMDLGELDGYDFISYLRFPSVAINPGDNILSAVLEVESYFNYATTTISWIFGNKTVNASAPTTYADAEAKQRTAASRIWTASDWLYRVKVTAPSVTNIIQEIVDLDGWKRNNALMLILPNHVDSPAEKWKAFYGNTAGREPTLTITFETTVLR